MLRYSRHAKRMMALCGISEEDITLVVREGKRENLAKPCVAGTRIPVEDVLEFVQEEISFKDIIEEYYPELAIEDVKACARYATQLVKHEEVHIGVG
jgi:uncharacterized protein (DUF433 family)